MSFKSAKLGGPLLEPKLHEIRFDRCQRPFKGATEFSDCDERFIGYCLSGRRMGEPIGEACRQPLLVGDALGSVRCVKRGVNLVEIPDVRTMNNGGAKADGLDRILAAMAGERSAHEHDRRQPIDYAEPPSVSATKISTSAIRQLIA